MRLASPETARAAIAVLVTTGAFFACGGHDELATYPPSGVGGTSAAGTGGVGGSAAGMPASGGASGDGGSGGAPCPTAVDDVPIPPLHTPRWAFEPWISKDISSTDDTYAFVDGFQSRDIPVGVVVLDSPWETNYQTFVPHPTQYHDFPKLISDMHAKDVRVVLWITAFVNTSSFDLETGGHVYDGAAPNWDEGDRCGFFVDSSREWPWWKGKGSALDYFDPQAVAWWHRQMDQVLDVGVDGFKCDFGDSYVREDPVQTAAGPVAHQAYSEAYYRDFFAYGVQKRGPEDYVTMVRPWDESYDFAGRFFARKEHAPVAWVGDNRRDWVGLADALDESFISYDAGYLVVGSDIGGYLDKDDENLGGPTIPFDTLVFARWTSAFAMMPFMQLHGRANIAPWTVPDHVDETVALYRYWAKLHHALVPFFASLVAEAEKGAAPPPVRPVGPKESWAGDYRFALGDAFLVAPMLDAAPMRDVSLPTGARWYDFFDDARDPIPGGTTLAAYPVADRAKMPLFLREGAIVPLDVEDDANGLGTAASKGALTLLVVPSQNETSFPVHEADGSRVTVEQKADASGAHVSLASLGRTALVRVRTDAPATTIAIDGTKVTPVSSRAALDAASSGAWVSSAERAVWVKVPAGASRDVVVSP